MKFKVFVFTILILSVFSCNKEDEIDFVYPLDYLPAYPGSYWTYTNGERVKVHTDYVIHNYQASLSSSEMTAKKKVPMIEGQYLYEYAITQSSTLYPLKTLLKETTGTPWEVDKVNGQLIKRETVEKKDSIPIVNLVAKDTVWYKDVLVVVEFIDTLEIDNWNRKEYYAKNYGLIKSEIDNPFDTLPAVIEKELIDSYINK